MKEKVLKGSTSIQNLNWNQATLQAFQKSIAEKQTINKPALNQFQFTEFPAWYKERPYLSWDFYPNPEKFEAVNSLNKYLMDKKSL